MASDCIACGLHCGLFGLSSPALVLWQMCITTVLILMVVGSHDYVSHSLSPWAVWIRSCTLDRKR